MTERIAIGDVVKIVYSCCDDQLGHVGVVSGFKKGRWSEILNCNICGGDITPSDRNSARMDGEYWPLSWLKRIDPRAEQKGIKIDEKIEEPA